MNLKVGALFFVSPLPVRTLERLQAPADVTFTLEASPEGAPEATAEAIELPVSTAPARMG